LMKMKRSSILSAKARFQLFCIYYPEILSWKVRLKIILHPLTIFNLSDAFNLHIA
jgi:hypothetical protein